MENSFRRGHKPEYALIKADPDWNKTQERIAGNKGLKERADEILKNVSPELAFFAFVSAIALLSLR